MFEDEPVKKARRHELGADLTTWSIGELEELLILLDQEKERVAADLARKKGAIGGAEALFRR